MLAEHALDDADEKDCDHRLTTRNTPKKRNRCAYCGVPTRFYCKACWVKGGGEPQTPKIFVCCPGETGTKCFARHVLGVDPRTVDKKDSGRADGIEHKGGRKAKKTL